MFHLAHLRAPSRGVYLAEPGAATAGLSRKQTSGSPRFTVRPNYVGLPKSGLDEDRTNAGGSLRDQGERMLPVRARKLRSEVENPAMERQAARVSRWRRPRCQSVD